jgi:hypothetical protein
VAKSQDG